MPSTASGTAYTVRTSTATGYGTTAMTVADAHLGDVNVPTVLYCHGASGAYDQFASLSAWQGLRDWLIDNGCAIVEGAGGLTDAAGAQHWGNADARLAYVAYVAHWDTVIDIGPIVPLGRSMGGAVTPYLFLQSALASRCVGYIGNSAVQTFTVGTVSDPNTDLRPTGQYFSTGTYPAYGVSTYAGFVAAASAFDPMGIPASAWDGKKVIQLWGDADTTVPYATRGAGPLRALYAGRPAIDRTDIRAGGDHSGTNGSYLQVSAMTAFLTEIGFVTPPAPQTDQFIVSNAAWLYTGGGFHALSPVF